MNDEIGDAIDRMLRDYAPDPVVDEGFCSHVMNSVPLRRPRAQWPLAIGALAGTLACWFTMGSAQVAMTGWQDWLSGDLTATTLALIASTAGLSLLALAWALTEAQDQAV